MADLHLRIDRSAGALADQVAEELRCAIRSGRLVRDTVLPASRSLAQDLDVSRGVVVSAYEQLVAEGFLIARQGSATKVAEVEPVPGRPAPRPVPAGAGIEYDMTIGTPDLSQFPRQQWLAAMRDVLRVESHEMLGYAEPGGVLALRVELSRYLRRVRAADVSPEQLVIVGGVAQGLHLTLRTLAAGRRFDLAVEDPHSVRSFSLIEASGATRIPVPVDEEGIDVEALGRTSARAVLVTPAHQYPTGVAMSPRRRAALIAWASDVDGYVLEDDYDAEFRYDRDPVGCLQALCPERVLLLGSVSKSLAPALRLGWLVGPPRIADPVRHARTVTDLGSPVLEQHALARFVATGGYDRHIRRMRRSYRSRRDTMIRALSRWLPEATVHGVAAGIQLYAELPAGCDESRIIREAARHGVAVDGISATRVSSLGPPGLLLSFARLPEHRIDPAIQILAAAIGGP